MMRKFAKSVLYHARSARIKALAGPRRINWLRRRLHLPSNHIFDPLGNETAAGVRVIRLDASQRFERPLPRLLSKDRPALSFFSHRAREVGEPAYVAEFERGVAWGHPTGGVFTAHGRFVPAFTHDPCGAEFHSVWTRLRLPRPKRVAGRVLYLVTPEAEDNFHHWMIDLLPRLGLVERAGYRLQDFDHVIVNHAGRKYQRATLEHLGVPPDRVVSANDSLWLRPDCLVVPSLKQNNQALPDWDVAFMRGAFLPASVARTGRKIYLSRGDASFRRLSNEAELIPLLESHGFEIITPTSLDVPSQARLFAEADVIAGPAGAAFANLIFASPGARVIEIAPPGWLAAFHWMISARLGLEHHILLGEGPVMSGVPDVSARERDITVDPAKLEHVLNDIAATSSRASA